MKRAVRLVTDKYVPLVGSTRRKALKLPDDEWGNAILVVEAR